MQAFLSGITTLSIKEKVPNLLKTKVPRLQRSPTKVAHRHLHLQHLLPILVEKDSSTLHQQLEQTQ